MLTGKLVLTQLLPAVHPMLPKIRVSEKLPPPRAAEEPAGVPPSRIVVATVGRAKRALEGREIGGQELLLWGTLRQAEDAFVRFDINHGRIAHPKPGLIRP